MRAAAALLLPILAGCGEDPEPAVLTVLLRARDGEEPLAEAASILVMLESDETLELGPIPVEPEGFVVDVDLDQVGTLHRAQVEALDAGGDPIARGATPDAPLGLLGGFSVALLLSPPGTAGLVGVEGLPPLRRAVPLLGQWIIGLDEAGQLAMLDLLTLARVDGVATLSPARPARLADLGAGRTLLVGGGEPSVVFDGTTNTLSAAGGAVWRSPTVVSASGGGAIALCDDSRDVVAFDAEGAVPWTAQLLTPRSGCAAAISGGLLVVVGGAQAPAEILDLESGQARVLTGEEDGRHGAAAVAVGEDVIVLGGYSSGEALADGVRLRLSCEDGCPAPIALTAPRGDPVAVALADGSILCAGGGTAERIDAASLRTSAVPLPADDGIFAAVLPSTEDLWLFGGERPAVFAP